MKWLKGLFVSEKEQPSDSNTDDPIATAEDVIAKAVIAETNELVAKMDSMASEVSELGEPSPEELAWTEWFNGLREDHKQFVELCDSSGIKVTRENLDEMLKAFSK